MAYVVGIHVAGCISSIVRERMRMYPPCRREIAEGVVEEVDRAQLVVSEQCWF